MRIIGGTHNGRRISIPKHFKTRPTTDLAKGALFNILTNRYNLEECTVLDLFSGTGNISYEFASHGVKVVDSVEIEFSHYKFIQKTGKDLGFKNINILHNNAFTFLKIAKREYDVIFADPPYTMENFERIIEMVFANKLLNSNGCLIVEHSIDTDLSASPHFIEKRKYGSVNFSFFRVI